MSFKFKYPNVYVGSGVLSGFVDLGDSADGGPMVGAILTNPSAGGGAFADSGACDLHVQCIAIGKRTVPRFTELAKAGALVSVVGKLLHTGKVRVSEILPLDEEDDPS